jgi:hypothetical protein
MTTSLRQPKGARTGGQFASTAHAEPDFMLELPRHESVPVRRSWTDKQVRSAAEARQAAAEALKQEMAAASASLTEKKRTADQAFFDWDTDFTAGSLRGRFQTRYLKGRTSLRKMFSDDPDYRYNREYAHKSLAPLRESAQVLITGVLNRVEERTGGAGDEWYIRL